MVTVTAALFAVLTISSLILLWIYSRYRKLTVLKRFNIPGPEPHFIFGNFPELRHQNVTKINEWIDKYGKICGYYDGPVPTVIVTDIELLKRIQIKDFKLFSNRKGLVKGGTGGDSTSTMAVGSYGISAKRWKEQRSMLTTTFTSQKMKQSVPLINDAIDAFADTLNSKLESGSNEIDLYEMWQGLTMDTIGRSAFGILTDVQRNPKDPFLNRLRYLFNDNFSKLINVLLLANIFFPEFISIIYPIRYVQMKIASLFGQSNTHELRSIVEHVIDERRKMLVNNRGCPRDLLQLMIECNLSDKDMKSFKMDDLTASTDDHNDRRTNGKQSMNGLTTKGPKDDVHRISDQEIAANSIFFFAAGYETTSTLLGFMTHLLINHHDVQDKIRNEVQELYQKEGGKLNYNVVNELPYLDAVINESLRLYTPITTFVTRVSDTNYHYKSGDGTVDIIIPKGCNILVPVNKLHKDPNVWTDPEKFDPERFLNKKKTFDSISFQPFGAGPRNCIGMRFALLEAKLAVARLLHNYKLELGPRSEVGEITKEYKVVGQTPKFGVHCRVVKIN